MSVNPFAFWGLFLLGVLIPTQEEDDYEMARHRRKGKNRSKNIRWNNRSGGTVLEGGSTPNGTVHHKKCMYPIRFYTEGLQDGPAAE